MFNQINLEKCFTGAKETNAKYIGVVVKTPKSEEVIVINNKDFDTKLSYYQNAYTDELKLKTCENVEIVGFSFGNSYSVLEYDLIDPAASESKMKFEITVKHNDEIDTEKAKELLEKYYEEAKYLIDTDELQKIMSIRKVTV